MLQYVRRHCKSCLRLQKLVVGMRVFSLRDMLHLHLYRLRSAFSVTFIGVPTVANGHCRNLWQYWDVILQKMPKECSSAVQDVSEYIDKVAANKDKQEEEELKRLLGLDGVTHMVDVANSSKSHSSLKDKP